MSIDINQFKNLTTAVTKLPQICESAKKIEVNLNLKNCSPLKVADLNLRQMQMVTVSKTFENGFYLDFETFFVYVDFARNPSLPPCRHA